MPHDETDLARPSKSRPKYCVLQVFPQRSCVAVDLHLSAKGGQGKRQGRPHFGREGDARQVLQQSIFELLNSQKNYALSQDELEFVRSIGMSGVFPPDIGRNLEAIYSQNEHNPPIIAQQIARSLVTRSQGIARLQDVLHTLESMGFAPEPVDKPQISLSFRELYLQIS